MSTRTTRALVVAMALNVVLAAALLFLWWRSHQDPASESAKHDSSQMTNANPSSMNAVPDKTGNASQPEANNDPVLAPVQLTPQRLQSIGVRLGTAQMKAVSDEIRVTGNVEIDERQLATVQLRFPGWIHQVFVNATYDYVRKGQPLFTIYSPDLVTTEQEYLLARKNQQELQHSSVPGVAASADTLVSAARERLQQWDVPQSEIAKIESTGKPITDLVINSPVSGYITERNALPNMYVQPESKLYTVAGLSTVWINAQVFQTDIGRIKPGNPATVTVDSYLGKTFKGKVDSILPQVDMTTRTARVRLVFPNPGLLLKPGMFVNVQLKTPAGKGLTVPASSIFHSGTRNLVFVNQGEGNFEPREVEVGSRVGEEVVVVKGLKPGESVVTSANFLIDSEAQLQAAAGAFVPPPPGAGAAASMNRPESAPQADIELSTDPQPPKKGSNVFRVKLTGANGSAIAGAQVTVTFFMPAMPAMGMAAMRGVTTLTEKGGGTYEGSGQVQMGGTWQVTILATKNGQTLAQKQFNVTAEGGM